MKTPILKLTILLATVLSSSFVVNQVEANPRILYLPFTDPEVFLKHGWFYDENETQLHAGIDYFKGQSQNWQSFEILAAADGVATYRPNGSPTWGNYVFIEHPTGSPTYYSVYAHLENSPLPPNVPTSITKGQLIGIAGATGYTEPPGTIHLHLEWSKDGIGQFGTKLDPYGIKRYYTYYPGYPNFTDCGTDPQNPGVFWWTQCPPVSPDSDDEPLPVIPITGTISEDTTWWPGFVYLIKGSVTISEGVTLEVMPGVIVKFENTSSRLNVYGTLFAYGQSDQKIYFTSYKDDSVGGDSNGNGSNSAPAPEDYIGIKLLNSGSADISHATLRYGGKCEGQYSCQTRGVLSLFGNGYLNIFNSLINKNNLAIYQSSGGSTINVLDTTLDNNGGNGLLFSSNVSPVLNVVRTKISNHGTGIYAASPGEKTANFSIIDSEFENNQTDGYFNYGYLYYPYGYLNFVSQGNTTYGSGRNGFHISGSLPGNQVWNPGVPYIVSRVSIPAGANLTINPGTIIKLMDNWSNYLRVDGHLSALGSPQDKIYFTSYKDDSVGGDSNGDGNNSGPAPEDFVGIVLSNNGIADISNAVLSYGGACAGQYSCIQRGVVTTTGNGTKLNIVDSLIARSKYGVYRYNGGDINITNSSIKNNSYYGVIYTGSGDPVKAENNWWGHASGPYHSTNNPNGQGDRVSNNVEFIPWLIEDPFWKKWLYF